MYLLRALADDVPILVLLFEDNDGRERCLAPLDLVAHFEPLVVRQAITFRVVLAALFDAPPGDDLVFDHLVGGGRTSPVGNLRFHINKSTAN